MSVKAFELVPVLERSKLSSDKTLMQIECIENCGKNLYIGTSECFVIHYLVEEHTQISGRVVFNVEKKGHKYLAVKKPIVMLKTAANLKRILILCDNTLTLLNMFDLEPLLGGAKVKNVSSFCINEHPVRSDPFSIQMCVATKKKAIQIYCVTEDKMQFMRDVSLPEPPLNLSMDSHFVCVACTSQYIMVDFENGSSQDLFPYENEFTTPLIMRISREEFLLSGPSALGMFVTSAGISQRPPLPWNEHLIGITFLTPYVVALNDEFITIHSILDQQQKQTISFLGGQCIGEFNGRVLVSTSKDIYALVPVPWEKQIQGLLSDKRVKEALELAKTAKRLASDREQFMKLLRRIHQQAGFIEFSQRNFEEAKDHFQNGRLDVRELLALYPGLLPITSSFTRSVPPLHEIADINQLSHSDNSKMKEYKRFLMNYLEEMRLDDLVKPYQEEIDSALLKLYAEMDSPELITLIATTNTCNPRDCEEYLLAYQRFNALALMYKFQGDYDKAIQIWTKIISGEYPDESFQGLDFLIETLANLEDHSVVWKHAEWVLSHDEEKGVAIFIQRPQNEHSSEAMNPDAIIDYLHRFPKAVIAYLEFLVFTKKIEKEKYHTHLAVLYLDNILKLKKSSESSKEEIDLARSKFQHLLQLSNLYRVQLILGKVKESEMFMESAILYGKLGEHDQALRIIVHKLKDYNKAEKYCLINSDEKDKAFRRRLFQILLNVYLDPTYDRNDQLVTPAISLLNSNDAEFDTVKVLQALPENWSVGRLNNFVSRSIRVNMDRRILTKIQRMLARCDNINVKHSAIVESRETIVMNEEKRCGVCNKGFTEPNFCRYPNGIITHIRCAKNKTICPVSGKIFSAPQKPKD